MSTYKVEVDGRVHEYTGSNGFLNAMRHANMADRGKDGLSQHNVRFINSAGTVLFSTRKGERTGMPKE